MIQLTINNSPVEVPEGATILQAAQRPASASRRSATSSGCRRSVPAASASWSWKALRTSPASCSMPVARGNESPHEHPPRAQSAAAWCWNCCCRNTTASARPATAARTANCRRCRPNWASATITYRGREDQQAHRHLDPGVGPRPRQVHQVPPVRQRLRRNPARRGTVGPGPRVRHGDRAGVQPRLEHRRLRAVRTVCRRLPRRRDHGTRSNRSSLGRLDDPDKFVVVQTAPAIRAALGECFGYPARNAGHGKDGRRLAATGIQRRLRHELRRRPHDPGGRHRTAQPPATRARSRDSRRPCPCSPAARRAGSCTWSTSIPDLLPNLSTCKSPQQMFGAVAKTYYAEKLRPAPGADLRDVRSCPARPRSTSASGRK